MCGSDVFLGLIAIIFPPIAVWVKRGVCSADSLINIALCCLGFLPGLLHAWYIIAKFPDSTYDEVPQQDPERGNVTYYYVQRQPPRQGGSGGGAAAASGGPRVGGGQVGYGAMHNSAPNAQFPAHAEGFVRPHGAAAAASGPSEEVPPTYQQAVQGDHKVQRS